MNESTNDNNGGRERDRRDGVDRRHPTTWWGRLPDAWKLTLTTVATASAFFTAGLAVSNRVALQDQIPPRLSALEVRVTTAERAILSNIDGRTADRRLLLYVACRVDGIVADDCIRTVLNPERPASSAVKELLQDPQ